jgi:hypothetical protein
MIVRFVCTRIERIYIFVMPDSDFALGIQGAKVDSIFNALVENPPNPPYSVPTQAECRFHGRHCGPLDWLSRSRY